IDLSQQEASLYALDAALLQQTVNGVQEMRNGNRHPAAAPHGVYACRGDDRWIAIAVFTDAQWRGFLEAADRPAWGFRPQFETFVARKAHEDELDRLVGQWTAAFDAHAAMRLLQQHGVPAGVVQDARDLTQDPQLQFRNHFLDLAHPMMGDFPFDSLPYRMNGVQPVPAHAAPLLGQDNAEIFKGLLGLSSAEYEDLEKAGVIE
ncbi:MAG TPA: CoA transferase, partial [Dehalococcoidia bacterium]|nr:CoA transferase [Dehalococcoidia bacterium]